MTEILVAECHTGDRQLYEESLRGCHLSFCADGREALVEMRRGRQRFALILLNWESYGPESLTHLKREFPNVPVIVVGSVFDLNRAAHARRLGATDFLWKPVDSSRLRSTISRILAGPEISPILDALRRRFIGESDAWLATLDRLAKVIPLSRETVLVTGDHGVGKELVARAIADLGATDVELGRHGAESSQHWLAVNVASISPNLMEAALFGHEEGAFTDARARRSGYFHACGNGVLFLDEIGELDLSVQAKLLRVVQERVFFPVGGTREVPFSGRLIAATNRELVTEVRTARFREDLYHRLSAHEVRLPPLRDRRDDLWSLAKHFLTKHGAEPNTTLSREVRHILAEYSFPGNVRELENLIKHALAECPDGEIVPFHLPVGVMQERLGNPSSSDHSSPTWPQDWLRLPQKEALKLVEDAFHRDYLPRLLELSHGNISLAARTAGIDPKTFRKKWEDAGLGPLNSADL